MVGNGTHQIRRAALVAFALAAASCSGSTTPTTTVAPTTTAPPTTTTVTTTTVPPTTVTTTTTEPPTTTVDPLARPDKLVSNFDRDSVDDFDTTGDNLWQVMMEIVDLFDYFEGNPQGTGDEMLGLFYAEEYDNFDQLSEGLDELTTNDWRYVDPGTRTVAIDVDSVDGDSAVVRWASDRGEQLIADANGEVVKTLEGWNLDIITYVLKRGPDNRWRIAEFVERLSPVPQDVLAAMVPVEWTGRTR